MLPPWTMNVAGLVYLPLFLVRLRTIGPTHIARPMVELLMFGLVMRLFGMRREREKWHVAVLLFFLFVAAMATSVHPLILVYLRGRASCSGWCSLVRFLQLHLEETYPLVVPGSRLSPQRLITSFALLTVLVAVPFFTLLPRLRTPYIMGSGGSRQAGYSTGFRDEVNLDVVGNIRANPAVALRMKPEDSTVTPPTLLRGTTYDLFRDNTWLRSRSQPGDPGADRPATSTGSRPAPVDAKIRIFLEPIDTRSLDPAARDASRSSSRDRLFQDVAGAILMLQQRPDAAPVPRRHRVAAGPSRRAAASRRSRRAHARPRRHHAADRGPRQEARRGSTAGGGGAAASSSTSRTTWCTRSTSSAARRTNPIEDFLFRYKSGHCEYFATAMILMLRSVGIPARLATGFLGAEFNPLEDYYIVRQSNAHAWVEAYLPETGWTTIDPTPPAGRPAAETRPTMTLMLRQAWDYLEFRWDRYVMSYGFFDQVGFLLRVPRFPAAHGGSGERTVAVRSIARPASAG